jgi:hypothetical protein
VVVHLWDKKRDAPLIGGRYMVPYDKKVGDETAVAGKA